MHVMMSINSLRLCPVQAREFVTLDRHDILKAPDESGVKHDLGEAIPPQVPGQPLLMLDQPPWAVRR
jgi:hypothetical protein